MTPWLKAMMAVARASVRLLSLARRIPIIDDLCDRASRFLFNPVVVRRIRNPDDPDLDAALQQLYEKKIPEEQRFPSADIVRWIRDDRDSRRTQPGRPIDWFLVAKYRRRVCGFVLFHYFPRRRIAFFAYMVVLNTPGVPLNAVAASLCSMVSRLLKTHSELKECRTLLFEVDDPRVASSEKKQEECLARIRRFCTLAEMQCLSMRVLNIAYRQPKLSLTDHTAIERPLILLFALSPHQQLAAAEVDPEDVKNILAFIYTDLYPEGFSTIVAENEQYQGYCQSLLEEVLRGLPQPVTSLSGADLVAQVRNSRGKKPSRRTRAAGHPARVSSSTA